MTGRSCWCLELFRSGQLTARNIDVVECSRLAPAVASPEAASTQGLRCHASVPLYAGDRPLGVMNLAMRGWRRLTRQELDLLTTIADQVGVAIERARLGEQSVEHARADERSRIARDVHDTLAQEFTAVGAAHRGRPVAARAARPARAAAEAGARRRPPGSRRGPALDHEPAHVAAREPLARRGARRRCRASSRPTPACACSVDIADVGPLPAETESELFRIAGEALTNVRKHASAREVSLRLGRAPVACVSPWPMPAPVSHARRAPSRVRPVRHRRSRPQRRRARDHPQRARARHRPSRVTRTRCAAAMIKRPHRRGSSDRARRRDGGARARARHRGRRRGRDDARRPATGRDSFTLTSSFSTQAA